LSPLPPSYVRVNKTGASGVLPRSRKALSVDFTGKRTPATTDTQKADVSVCPEDSETTSHPPTYTIPNKEKHLEAFHNIRKALIAKYIGKRDPTNPDRSGK